MAGSRLELPLDRVTLPKVRWERAGLWAASVGAATLLLMPVLYLLVRFAGAGPAVWGQLITASTAATLGRTLLLALAVTAASALVAVPAAWLTTRSDLPARRLLAVLLALPMVIPSYVGAYLLVAFLGPRGMLAQVSGLTVPPLYGFPGAFLVLTLLCYPYLFLAVRSALQGIDPALEEAARSLGYSPWGVFRRVTLPHLRPALAAGGLLVALYVLRDFGAVSILRYDTFTRVIYIQYQSAFDRQAASGPALLLVALTLVLLALEARARGQAHYRRMAGGTRTAPITRLGVWKLPALAFCAAIVTLALAMPVGVLTYWLARGLQVGEQLAPLWESTRNSLLASGLAAVITLALALLPALLSARAPGKGSSLLYGLAYAGYALPGIVVALAVVFFGLRFAEPLYGSLTMLLLAYVILFAPQAMGVLRGALLQLPAHVEDAARSLGRSPLRVLAEVTLPLIRPGLRAGAALVFLTTMKELPATLILSPLGFETLAVDLWSSVSEAFFARAAAPALLLVLFSSVPAAFFLSVEQK